MGAVISVRSGGSGSGTLVIAHRGDVENAPENTLPAFESAIQQGADGVELDVYLSTDEELVVHHNHYLGATNAGSGPVGDHTLAQLRELDAGSWFGAQYVGEKIPTLDEVLDLVKGRSYAEIEMKGSRPGIVDSVVDRVRHHGVAESVWLTSLHTPLLMAAKQLESSMPIGIFFMDPLPDWMEIELREQQIIDLMVHAQGDFAHLPDWLISERFVNVIKAHGFGVHGAGLNTEKEICDGLRSGVDKFSTDRLTLALTMRAAGET